MLGKKSKPVIEKLATELGSGYQAVFTETATSPKSPLDFKIQSPRGLLFNRKKYDVGGIGLGIVAALEKSGEQNYGREIRAAKALFLQSITRSDPIPVNNKNLSAAHRGGGGGGAKMMEEMDFDDSSEEEYTYVTRRGGPNNEASTRVYCDGVEQRRIVMGEGRQILDSRRRSREKNPAFCCIFDISPARFSDDSPASPTFSDFLSSCHFCLKKLHGKDIYMYRGERGFCSPECRYRQILMDERKDQHYCSSEASRSSLSSRSRSRDHANVIKNASTSSSSSPYSNAQIFSPEILAT